MLTATQKINLYDKNSNYMVAANLPYSEWDAKREIELLSEFTEFARELGLTACEASAIAWEVALDYENTLLEAIKEGYTNKYLTTEVVEKLRAS